MDGVYAYTHNPRDQNKFYIFHEVRVDLLLTSMWVDQNVTIELGFEIKNNKIAAQSIYGLNGANSFTLDGTVTRFEDN